MGWITGWDGRGYCAYVLLPCSVNQKTPKPPKKRNKTGNKTGMSMILSKWILTPDK